MTTPAKQLRHWFRLLADDGLTISILAAVVATSVLAFGLGATYELVGALLIFGLITAVVEARLHAKNRR